MPKKKFVLRIDEKTMSAVEKWASDEFRSVNGHLEWIITRALQKSGRVKKDSSQTKDPNTTDQDAS